MLNNYKVNKIKNYGLIKNVGLFCNARDEKNIVEWVAHHLLIGFDKIIIFDNKSKISIKKILFNFDNRVIVIDYNPNNSNGIKIPLMNLALNISRHLNFDWFIYLDADEFIILNNKLKGIKHLLNYYNFADSLALNWLMFGSNNLINDPEGLILENYTKSELILNNHVKCFVRPYEAIKSLNPHYYIMKNKNKIYSLNKRLNSASPFNDFNIKYNNCLAYIAHFVNQSCETYKRRKYDLPRDDNGINRCIDINNLSHIHNQYNDVNNFYPRDKYVENIKNFIKYKKLSI
jgi:hypothetical protein